MQVSTNTLEFKGDFKSSTSTHLSLKNPTNSPLAFKIKTNAPKVYSVKPNYGIIKPNETTKVSISLGSLSQSLPKNYKSNHKFLVISLPTDPSISESEILNNWNNLQSKFSNSVQTSKIKVKYLTGGANEKLNGRSQRISKFVPNGSVHGDFSNSNSMGAAAGGAALGAAAGVGAGMIGGGSGSMDRSGSTATAMTNTGATMNGTAKHGSHPYRNEIDQQQRNISSSNGNGSTGGYQYKPPVVTGPSVSELSNEVSELSAQNERLVKKVENIEKLMILALMLLSFIIGRSVV